MWPVEFKRARRAKRQQASCRFGAKGSPTGTRNGRGILRRTELWTIGLADPWAASFTDLGTPLLPLRDASTTGSTVGRQHEQDIVNPPSIIKLFQEHPSDITLVGAVELIRMQKAVTLLIWPRMNVIALT
jgi:hypothetical protein